VGKRVNEGDEGEGIWWMDFIYLYKIEQKPHAIDLRGTGRGLRREMVGVTQPM
jgi:hypothetical protein